MLLLFAYSVKILKQSEMKIFFLILNEILNLEFNLSSESLFHVKFQKQSKLEHPPIIHTHTHIDKHISKR